MANTLPKVSVIVPVYNVEKYLDEFFSSLTKQSLNFKNHIKITAKIARIQQQQNSDASTKKDF